MSASLVSLREIEETRDKLPKLLRHTPLVPFAGSPGEVGVEQLYLKAENLQITGAFKPRAAFARIAALSRSERSRGIVLMSSGNFAQAFALAGRLNGVHVTCVMLDRTSPFKVEMARAQGAEIVFCGTDPEARPALVRQIAHKRGLVAVDIAEDRQLIAGHGSIGLEILEDCPDVKTVLVPVSTGGGAAGIAAAIKQRSPSIKVIGVQPVGANAAYLSLRAGRPETISHWDTMADGLSAVRPGTLPFEHLRHYLDGIVLVSEGEIARACEQILVCGKLIAEPAGATAVAGFLGGKVPRGERTVAVVTGGNVSPLLLHSMLQSRREISGKFANQSCSGTA